MVSVWGSIVLYIILVVVNWRQHCRLDLKRILGLVRASLTGRDSDEALDVRTPLKNHALSTRRPFYTRSDLGLEAIS